MFESIFSALSKAAPLLGAGAKLYAANETRKASNRQAKLIREQSSRDAALRQRQNQRLLASQRARYSAAGVTLEGTPGLVMDETDSMAAQDIADLYYFGNQNANAARRTGRAGMIGGTLDAGGSLLGGYDNWKTLFGW
ncbi:hypothetical protein [Thalassospira povalilytica]|uniref:hypothetical protein n=1 Tax=Thalassospira povalilytica TaxID=732237 RepID=UPI001D197B15|nr:hypothetical protein [Thalassospira povalilytica]MCC4240386.1 hypothetical protein [Thalassospira povalilytica]